MAFMILNVKLLIRIGVWEHEDETPNVIGSKNENIITDMLHIFLFSINSNENHHPWKFQIQGPNYFM